MRRVSRTPETRGGFRSYRGRTGGSCHQTRVIHDVTMAAPCFARAALILPDDFAAGDVLILVRHLLRSCLELLLLLVTKDPQ